MGHSTATVFVQPEWVKDKTEYRGWGPRWNSSGEQDRILGTAVDIWNSDYRDRDDDANPGEAVFTEPAPQELVNDRINEFYKEKKSYSAYSPVVPVIDSSEYEIKSRVVSVKLVGDEWLKQVDGYGDSYDLLLEKVLEKLPDLKGKVTGLSVVKDEGKNNWDSTNGWNVKSSVDVDTSGGKAKTEYVLTYNKNQTYKDTFPTQAAARAVGIQLIENNLSVSTIDIRARLVREDDSALVKIRRNVKSATANVTVSYVKYKNPSQTPKTKGWSVAFDYHH